MVCNFEQDCRDISSHTISLAGIILKSSLVSERQHNEVPWLPGIFEGRLERVPACAAIIREQHPRILLTKIPEGTIVKPAWDSELTKSHKPKIDFGQQVPQSEFFEPLAKVGQMALHVHAR
jgi:hypothetical protein